MITSFVHKGLRKFYENGNKAGIQPEHAGKLRRILTALDVATVPDDVDLPGFNLHDLKGEREGDWAVTVRANWRVTFRFTGNDVELLNYEDYH